MRRLGIVSAITAVILLGLMPGAVAAAPVMTFGSPFDGLVLKSPCINGGGPANSAVHVVWKRADGVIKAIVDVSTNAGGKWTYCSASRSLGVGDTIRASSGAFGRKFTMPKITLTSNRVTQRFSGFGLPGSTGQLAYMAGIFADYDEVEEVTANSQGRWTSTAGGATGGISAMVAWSTPQGDHLWASSIVAQASVTIGRSGVEGGWNGFSDVTVSLRDPATNALRGRARTRTGEYGQFRGTFRDAGGDPVEVRVGDRVVSPIASNLDWHVPAISGSANTATNFVFGNCGSSEIDPIFALIRVFRTGDHRGLAIVDVDSNGDFEADFNGTPFPFYDPANIKHGDRIVVHCYYETYDVVGLSFRVP